MISPLSLESLLLALREARLPVGVAEIDRLRQVFVLQPDVASDEPDQTRRRLRVWLRALLVKSAQDRATFERIYDRWLARAEQDFQFRTLPESPPAPLPSSPPLPQSRSPVVERDWARVAGRCCGAGAGDDSGGCLAVSAEAICSTASS